MGDRFLDYYRHRISRETKLAILSAIVIGLLVHVFKFVNVLPHQDSLFNFYSTQNMTKSGRWFLSVACSVSSLFDLPWITGLLALIWIALTSAIIIDIFKIRNKVLIVLVSGLLVSFPAVTATFSFGYTSDGYMLAMLFSAIAVRLSLIESSTKYMPVSMLFLCLACGIYQAYLSFALVLSICYFALELLDNRYPFQVYLKFIVKHGVCYVLGVISYFVVWKICLSLQGGLATTYQGMELSQAIDIHTINGALYESFLGFMSFFVGYSEADHHTWASYLNVTFLLLTTTVVVIALWKSGIYKRRLQLLLLGICLALIPVAVYIMRFISPGVAYGTRMLQSICLIYIMVGVICVRWIHPNLSDVVAVCLSLLVISNSLTANIFYWYMDRMYTQSYATAIELSTRMHLLDDGSCDAILIVGELDEFSDEMYDSPGGLLQLGSIKTVRRNLFSVDSTTSVLFLSEVLDFELAYYTNQPDRTVPLLDIPVDSEWPMAPDWECYFPLAQGERAEAITASTAFAEMNCWPAADAVQIIDNTIVIKLSDVEVSGGN